MTETTPNPTPPGSNDPAAPQTNTSAERKLEEALFQVFDEFALGDQRSYYEAAINKANTAASQINMLRAFFSLVTGIAAALAGLIVQSKISDPGTCATASVFCTYSQPIVVVLLIIAVVAPAIGGAFGTLADLYQWDRLETIYQSSLETLEVASALKPDPQQTDNLRYRDDLRRYTEGTLGVMRDEASQWGQLIRDPLTAFVNAEKIQAQKDVRDLESAAVNYVENRTGPVTPTTNQPAPVRDPGIIPTAPPDGTPSEGGVLPPGVPPTPSTTVPPNLDPTADG